MSDTRPCPFCAEDIKSAAIKCKHCGEMLDQRPAQSASYFTAGEASPQLSTILAGCTLALGIALFGYAMNMDTTVALPSDSAAFLGYDRVNNIGLMAQQANYRNAGGFLGLVGLLWLFFAHGGRPPSGPSRITLSAGPTPQPPPAEDAASVTRRMQVRRQSDDWEKTITPGTRQGIIVALLALVFISTLVVYKSTKNTTPEKTGVKTESLARSEIPLAEMTATEAPTPEVEKMRKNQCFHRDARGNRDCTSAQEVGLYCGRHKPFSKQPEVPEPEVVVEEPLEYDFSYEPYVPPVYVSGSVDKEAGYPQTDPDTIYVPHKDGTCFYSDSRGNYTCRRAPVGYSSYCAKHRGY